jgi:Tol biopolymer transport system component
MSFIADVLSNLIGEIIFAIGAGVLGLLWLRARRASKSQEGRPVVSGDKSRVAYEYEGDIWLKGQNLTHHPARDFLAIWSPDNKYIAFVSDREGNNEVYVLNVKTAKTFRITSLPGADIPVGWNVDGDLVVKSQDEGMMYYRQEEIDNWTKE